MLLMPKWQVLSAMSSTPLWLKCASTLEKFRRAMVISLMTHFEEGAERGEDALLAFGASRSRPRRR